MKRVVCLTLIPLLFTLLTGCGSSPLKRAEAGIEALNRGEPGKAAKRLRSAVDELPESLDRESASRIQEALGLALYRSGDPDGAIEPLKKAATLTPDRFTPLYNLGMLELERGEIESGIGWLEQAVTAKGNETPAHEALAVLALNADQLDTAIDWLQRARSRSETARILTALAVARQHRAPVDELRELLQTAVSQDPAYAPAQLNLAALLDNHRLDPEQAMSHYEAFLRLRPDSVETARVRQRIQVMASRNERGEFARPDPVRREIEDLLAQATGQARAGQTADALRICLQANAAATRHHRTDLKERALRAAATLAPESPRGHFGLGKFLLSQERKPEALTSLIRAHRRAPAWAPALEAVVTLAVELRQPTQAREALTRAEENSSQDPGLLITVGEMYADLIGDAGEARRVYRLWLERFPDHTDAEKIRQRL